MAVNFAELFLSLQGFGLFEFFLPFLLIFAIVFAILQKIKVLGDKKAIHAIVSIAIGLLAVQNSFIIYLINNFLSNIALVLVIIIIFLVIIGLLAGEEVGAKLNWFVIGVALIGIFWALFYDLFAKTWILPEIFLLTGATQGSLLAILVFIVVIFIIIGGGGGVGKGESGPLFRISSSGKP